MPRDLTSHLIQAALAIAFFAPLTTAGINLAQRRQDLAPLGHLTALAAVAAAAVVLVSVWSDSFPFGNWRPATYALLIALAVVQVPVLLALADRSDPDWAPLLRSITLVAAALTAVLAIDEVSTAGPDGNLEAMAAAGAIYALGTLVLLLTSMFRPATDTPESAAPAPGPAQLEHVDHPCFAWGGSAESAIDHLHSHGLHVLGSPTPRTGAYGRGQSIFFHDSAGRLVELIVYG